MFSRLVRLAVLASAIIVSVNALAPTDTYRDADDAQSGYLDSHNMDPAVVDSTTFGQLWKQAYNALEQVGKDYTGSRRCAN